MMYGGFFCAERRCNFVGIYHACALTASDGWAEELGVLVVTIAYEDHAQDLRGVLRPGCADLVTKMAFPLASTSY